MSLDDWTPESETPAPGIIGTGAETANKEDTVAANGSTASASLSTPLWRIEVDGEPPKEFATRREALAYHHAVAGKGKKATLAQVGQIPKLPGELADAQVNVMPAVWKLGQHYFGSEQAARAARDARHPWLQGVELEPPVARTVRVAEQGEKPEKPKAPAPKASFITLDGDDDPGPRPWLVPGILTYGQITGLVASGGTGKSALSLHIALMVASGKPFLGWQPRDKCKVLILASEDDINEQTRRLFAAREAMGITPDEHRGQITALASGGILLYERDNEGNRAPSDLYNQAVGIIEEQDIGLVVIDPFVETTRGFNENSNDDVAEIVSRLRDMARKNGTAVMLVHHARKGAGDGNQDAARGASAFVNMCRHVINLERMSKDEAKRLKVSNPERYMRLDTAKVNHAAREGTRWLELVPVDLACGESAPGIQLADGLNQQGSWAQKYLPDIEKLVCQRQWSSRKQAPKANRLETALAELYDLPATTAREAVEYAAAQRWIYETEVDNRGKPAFVWALWSAGSAPVAQNEE